MLRKKGDNNMRNLERNDDNEHRRKIRELGSLRTNQTGLINENAIGCRKIVDLNFVDFENAFHRIGIEICGEYWINTLYSKQLSKSVKYYMKATLERYKDRYKWRTLQKYSDLSRSKAKLHPLFYALTHCKRQHIEKTNKNQNW